MVRSRGAILEGICYKPTAQKLSKILPCKNPIILFIFNLITFPVVPVSEQFTYFCSLLTHTCSRKLEGKIVGIQSHLCVIQDLTELTKRV